MQCVLFVLVEMLNIVVVLMFLGMIGGVVMVLFLICGLVLFFWLVLLFWCMMDIVCVFLEMVIVLMLIFVLGGGLVFVVIVIVIYLVGVLGKLFLEVVENVSLKLVEGLEFVGVGWFQCMWFGIVLQVVLNWVSYVMLCFEINICVSVIFGFVGVGGIGYELCNVISWGQGKYDVVVVIFILLFLIIVFFD